jgi:hypothetical protein
MPVIGGNLRRARTRRGLRCIAEQRYENIAPLILLRIDGLIDARFTARLATV